MTRRTGQICYRGIGPGTVVATSKMGEVLDVGPAMLWGRHGHVQVAQTITEDAEPGGDRSRDRRENSKTYHLICLIALKEALPNNGRGKLD